MVRFAGFPWSTGGFPALPVCSFIGEEYLKHLDGNTCALRLSTATVFPSSSCSGSPNRRCCEICVDCNQFQGTSDDPGHGWPYFSIAIPPPCQHSTPSAGRSRLSAGAGSFAPSTVGLSLSEVQTSQRSAVSDVGSLVYPYIPMILKTG